jgi:cupin fold WbuC family metalloprotein
MSRSFTVDGVLRAFVLDASDAKPGVAFFSEDSWPMQLGVMQWQDGQSSRQHKHNPHPHTVSITSEALIVWNGKTDVVLYDHKGELAETIELFAGSVCLMFGGAHGIVVHEDSTITELKQGPYDGTTDKVWLDEVHG